MASPARVARRTLAGLGALLAVASAAGAAWQSLATRREVAGQPPPGRLEDVGGHRLHIWCTGAGSPTVVLETGLSGSTADWGFVQPEVATFTRVCSYDRGGHGGSRNRRRLRELQRDLAGLSERGCLVIAEESGHVVTADQPQVVVEAIRAAVMAARGSGGTLTCDATTDQGG